jgi:hypothetical protein
MAGEAIPEEEVPGSDDPLLNDRDPAGFEEATTGANGPASETEGPSVSAELVEPQFNEACAAWYASPPANSPAEPLPSVWELETCNGRDSGFTAFEVVAGRPVRVTLQNPEVNRSVPLRYVYGDRGYGEAPVTAGMGSFTLDPEVQMITFTPELGGVGGLYLGGGPTGKPPIRLLIEQE